MIFYLAIILPDGYYIVLVGFTKRQIRKLLDNITGIEKICDTRKLVEIYSSADAFINPSAEESSSLVTVEAMAVEPKLLYSISAR